MWGQIFVFLWYRSNSDRNKKISRLGLTLSDDILSFLKKLTCSYSNLFRSKLCRYCIREFDPSSSTYQRIFRNKSFRFSSLSASSNLRWWSPEYSLYFVLKHHTLFMFQQVWMISLKIKWQIRHHLHIRHESFLSSFLL